MGNQKRHLNLIFSGSEGKLIFDMPDHHFIRYIDFKGPTFNFMSFFPFSCMPYCKSILKISWQFLYLFLFHWIFPKAEPISSLETRSPQITKTHPSLKNHLYLSSLFWQKVALPKLCIVLENCRVGDTQFFFLSLLTYLE